MSRAIDPASRDAADTSERIRSGSSSSSNGQESQGFAPATSPGAGTAPTPIPVPSTGLVRESLAGKHVCPFCGQQNSTANEPCSRCTMEDTAATRQATKARIGPWYVLQTRNPAAPGMKYSTLLALVGKGQVTPKSVVRGPTTHQLWRFAAHVRGLSREFGICYSCGEAVERVASICPHCDRVQDPPIDPDALLEPRGNASSMLGGATGNSHLGGNRRAPTIIPPAHNPPQQQAQPQAPQQRPMPAPERDYEIPNDPPAYVTPRPPRGEHSERLRMFNQEMAGSQSRSPRFELARRDMRGGVSGTALASAFQSDPDDFNRRSGGLRRVLVVLVLLALGGGGVYYYLHPDARVQTGAWIQDALARARAKSTATNPDLPVWDSRPTPLKKNVGANTDNAIVDRSGGTSNRIINGADRSNIDVPSTNPSLAKFTIPQVPANLPPAPSTQPATAPARMESVAQADTKPPVTAKMQDKTPSKAVDKPAPGPKPSSQKQSEPDDQRNIPLTDDQAIARARTLWSNAIDAEQKGDYAEAVRCYEQIKMLPKAAHQAGLDFRLKNAQRMAGR